MLNATIVADAVDHLVRGIVSNPPGEISYGIVVRCYRMAQKIYKFN